MQTLTRYYLGLAVVLIAATAGFLLAPSQTRLWIIPAAAAIGVVIVQMNALRRPSLRSFWRGVQLMLALMFMGNLLIALNIEGSILFFLLSLGTAVFIISRLGRVGKLNRATTTIDLFIIVVGAAAVSWYLIISPALNSDRTSITTAVLPSLEVLLLPLIFRSALARKRLSSVLRIMLAGLCATIASDIAIALSLIMSSYQVGGWQDIGVWLAVVLIVCAAAHPRAAMVGKQQPLPEDEALRTAWIFPIVVAVILIPWFTEALDIDLNQTVFTCVLLVLFTAVMARMVAVIARSDALANLDDVTQLANRRAFLRASHDFEAVVLVDIRGFKLINDAQGSAFGDIVLRSVSRRLTHVAPSDAVVARLSGNEFAIAVAHGQGLDPLMNALQESFVTPLPGGGAQTQIGLAIGGASTAESGGSATLLAAASSALQQSKLTHTPVRYAAQTA